jgi:carbon storage regulator
MSLLLVRSENSWATREERKAMLVLTRRINESIVINDDVTILVVEVRGDRVRLGIEAPKDVTVHRKEVYDVIRESDTFEKPKK